jgi:hypothetical protein
MAGKYQAFDPNSEAIGSSLLGFIQCIRSKDIGPYLEKHGLTNIDPNGWYPVQTWLDVLSDLAEERPGQVMFDFVSVGMAVAAVIPLPEEYYASLPFEEALLASGGSGYKRNHRGDAGEHSVEKVGEHHIKITIRTPYPDDLLYGVYYGLSRRFLPPGHHFTLQYDEETPRRDKGGEVTIMHLTWE